MYKHLLMNTFYKLDFNLLCSLSNIPITCNAISSPRFDTSIVSATLEFFFRKTLKEVSVRSLHLFF